MSVVTVDGSAQPASDERPLAYADRLGKSYCAAVNLEQRKGAGQFFTPPQVAAFMADLAGSFEGQRSLRVLDAGMGSGVLACAAVERIGDLPGPPHSIELVGYESDPALAAIARAALSHATTWAGQRGVTVRPLVRARDFVIDNPQAFRREGRSIDEPGNGVHSGERFDVVLSNPPYTKINKADPRAVVASSIVHGQPNLYSFFMAGAASLLRPGGSFVFITPRSFASGPYFSRFRASLFRSLRPTAVHVFDSRKEAFIDDNVLQENIILAATKDIGWLERKNGAVVEVSCSVGVLDLRLGNVRRVRTNRLLELRNGDYVLRIPTSEIQDAVLDLVDSWAGRLSKYGLAISTGPVIPFRTRSIEDRSEKGDAAQAPLLWMQNVKAMAVEWPKAVRNKGQVVRISPESKGILVPNATYVLIRRFSAKEERRRLVAAPYIARMLPGRLLGLENHLNYVHRPGGSISSEEAHGLAALFNSELMDTYFRISNGNTQVSATEVRAMPLPPIETIQSMGRAVLKAGAVDADSIDQIVDNAVHGSVEGTPVGVSN